MQPSSFENEVYRPLTALDYLEINDLSNRASRFQSQQIYGKLDLTPFKFQESSQPGKLLVQKEQLSKTNINFFSKKGKGWF